jgi:hypothetical protein
MFLPHNNYVEVKIALEASLLFTGKAHKEAPTGSQTVGAFFTIFGAN